MHRGRRQPGSDAPATTSPPHLVPRHDQLADVHMQALHWHLQYTAGGRQSSRWQATCSGWAAHGVSMATLQSGQQQRALLAPSAALQAAAKGKPSAAAMALAAHPGGQEVAVLPGVSAQHAGRCGGWQWRWRLDEGRSAAQAATRPKLACKHSIHKHSASAPTIPPVPRTLDSAHSHTTRSLTHNRVLAK